MEITSDSPLGFFAQSFFGKVSGKGSSLCRGALPVAHGPPLWPVEPFDVARDLMLQDGGSASQPTFPEYQSRYSQHRRKQVAAEGGDAA